MARRDGPSQAAAANALPFQLRDEPVTACGLAALSQDVLEVLPLSQADWVRLSGTARRLRVQHAALSPPARARALGRSIAGARHAVGPEGLVRLDTYFDELQAVALPARLETLTGLALASGEAATRATLQMCRACDSLMADDSPEATALTITLRRRIAEVASTSAELAARYMAVRHRAATGALAPDAAISQLLDIALSAAYSRGPRLAARQLGAMARGPDATPAAAAAVREVAMRAVRVEASLVAVESQMNADNFAPAEAIASLMRVAAASPAELSDPEAFLPKPSTYPSRAILRLHRMRETRPESQAAIDRCLADLAVAAPLDSARQDAIRALPMSPASLPALHAAALAAVDDGAGESPLVAVRHLAALLDADADPDTVRRAVHDVAMRGHHRGARAAAAGR